MKNNLLKITYRTLFLFTLLLLFYELDIAHGSGNNDKANVKAEVSVDKPKKPASAKVGQQKKRGPHIRKAPIPKTKVRNRNGKLRRTLSIEAEKALINRINAKLGRKVAALNEKFLKLYYEIGPERMFGGVSVAPYKKPSSTINVVQNRRLTGKQKSSRPSSKDKPKATRPGEKQRRSKRSPEGSTPQIPSEFDLRKYNDMRKIIEPHGVSYGEHNKCHEVIARPSDQSACGCCWAVSTADMLRDRLCIAQVKQKRKRVYDDDVQNFGVSAADILACSGVGDCDSGDVTNAVEWARQKRVVSGGPFHPVDPKYCFPFPYPDIRTHNKGKVPEGIKYPNQFWGKKVEEICKLMPKCPEEKDKCPNSGYKREYGVDKFIVGRPGYEGQQDREAKRLYGAHADRERQIQLAILEGGPVVATIESYEDLRVYQRGQIYEKADVPDNSNIGRHAVRIIGWGEAGGKKYWLCGNTVGPDWGDNGFFRIVRGQNMVEIETKSIDWLVFKNVPEACTADKCEFDDDGNAKFVTKPK